LREAQASSDLGKETQGGCDHLRLAALVTDSYGLIGESVRLPEVGAYERRPSNQQQCPGFSG
jgi:hypothetical protein